jgi:hypothetical protein
VVEVEMAHRRFGEAGEGVDGAGGQGGSGGCACSVPPGSQVCRPGGAQLHLPYRDRPSKFSRCTTTAPVKQGRWQQRLSSSPT